MLQALTPVNLLRPADETPELFEAVIATYHNVLPNVGRRFMRRYLSHNHIHTLALLLPEAPEDNEDKHEEEEDDDDESESDDDDDEEEDDKKDDDSAEAPEEEEHQPSEKPPLSAAARQARRRLVGCVSYEYGDRLGQPHLREPRLPHPRSERRRDDLRPRARARH